MVSATALNFQWVYLNCSGTLPPYTDDKNGVNPRYTADVQHFSMKFWPPTFPGQRRVRPGGLGVAA